MSIAVLLSQEVDIIHPVLGVKVYPIGELPLKYEPCPAKTDIGRIIYGLVLYQ